MVSEHRILRGKKTALTCIYSKRFIECDANIRLDGKNTKIMEDIYVQYM